MVRAKVGAVLNTYFRAYPFIPPNDMPGGQGGLGHPAENMYRSNGQEAGSE
jgi:hypothetical protein